MEYSKHNKNLRSLTPRHYKILDLTIQGLPRKEICERVEISPRQLSTLYNSPSFKHQLAVRREKFEEKYDERVMQKNDEVEDTLRKSAQKAAEKMVGLIQSQDPKIAMRSAEQVLDRTGYGAIKKDGSGQSSNVNITINGDKLAVLTETLEMISNERVSDNHNST